MWIDECFREITVILLHISRAPGGSLDIYDTNHAQQFIKSPQQTNIMMYLPILWKDLQFY